MLISLIGFMGAGKSCVSAELSKLLEQPVYSTDALTEQREGASVAEIFERSGEARFRELELETLRELCLLKNGIIDCGGGIVMLEECRELLRRDCVSVWLRADIDTLCRRIAGNASRPLAIGKSRAQLERLLSEREPIYSQCASLEFYTDGENVQKTANRVAAALTDYVLQ